MRKIQILTLVLNFKPIDLNTNGNILIYVIIKIKIKKKIYFWWVTA